MTRKLCDKAQALKANYEKTFSQLERVEDASRAETVRGFVQTDKRAYARAMETHMRKCRLCS